MKQRRRMLTLKLPLCHKLGNIRRESEQTCTEDGCVLAVLFPIGAWFEKLVPIWSTLYLRLRVCSIEDLIHFISYSSALTHTIRSGCSYRNLEQPSGYSTTETWSQWEWHQPCGHLQAQLLVRSRSCCSFCRRNCVHAAFHRLSPVEQGFRAWAWYGVLSFSLAY